MPELVRVYRNLRNHKLSIQRYMPHVGWRVWTHADAVTLDGVTFKVSEASRQRVVRTKRKTVHAYVYGTLSNADVTAFSHGVPVTYNPYKYSSFVTMPSETPITTAYAAVIHDNGSILAIL